MSRFYRAFFRCSGDRTSNLTLDILIGENRHVVPRVPVCGWWGILKSNEVWPFVMLSEGKIDFGNTDGEPVEDIHRYGKIDIHDRIIATGERFLLEYDKQRFDLTLEKLTDITEL